MTFSHSSFSDYTPRQYEPAPEYVLNRKTQSVIAGMLNMHTGDIELTPGGGFWMRHYEFTPQLKALCNQDYAAFKREDYARRADLYREQAGYQERNALDLFNHFDGFRKWVNGGNTETPAAYADYGSYQEKRDCHGTKRQERYIMLQAPAFGLHLVISLDYLIDLLRILKQHKAGVIQVRAIPITPKLAGRQRDGRDAYHYSALEIRQGSDRYYLYSETQPEFDLAPDFTLYTVEALPGGDAGCFPAAHVKPVTTPVSVETPLIHEFETPFGVMVITPGEATTTYQGINQKLYIEGKDLITIHRILYHIEGNFERFMPTDGAPFEWRGWFSLKRAATCEPDKYSGRTWHVLYSEYATPKAGEHIAPLSQFVRDWLNAHLAVTNAVQQQAQNHMIQRGLDRLTDITRKVEERRVALVDIQTRLNQSGVLTPRDVDLLNTSSYHWRF
jgi:hypothetical protein